LADRIEKRQKQLTIQTAKIIELKEQNTTIDEFFKTWKQKQNEYETLVKSVKSNEELIKKQQEQLKKTQIAINENKKLIEQRTKEDEEIQITLASNNSQLEQQLEQVYEIKKNIIPSYNFDFDFDKLVNPTPINSVPNSPTTVKPLMIDNTIANKPINSVPNNPVIVKSLINNSTPVNSVPNSPAIVKPLINNSTSNSVPNSPAIFNKPLQVDNRRTTSSARHSIPT
ncbi:hypothetical protein ACJMK2_020164, partial [Sinanodonta woodiana]